MEEQRTMEISIVELFYYVLSKWRVLIMGAIICGILLGSYGGIRVIKNKPDEEEWKETQLTYEEDLKTYESKKEKLQIRINNLEETIAQQNYIQERSVMLRLDPYNIFETNISYYVDTGYEIIPELYYQNPDYTAVITNSYYSAISRLDIGDFFKTSECRDPMVGNPVSGNTKSLLFVTADPGCGTFVITVRADSQEHIDKICQAIQETIDETEALLNRTIHTHTLSMLAYSSDQTVDFGFADLQQSFNNNIYGLMESLTDANDELSTLEEPEAPSEYAVNIMPNVLEYGFVGLIVGLCFIVLVFALCFFINDPVLSAESIIKRYQIPVLGYYIKKNDRKRSCVDSLIARKLDIPNMDNGESVAYIKASKALYPLENDILLVSTSASDQLQEIYETLSEVDPETRYVTAGNLADSATAVNALSEAVSVICVEKWKKTSHNDFEKELAMIQQAVCSEKIAMIMVQ